MTKAEGRVYIPVDRGTTAFGAVKSIRCDQGEPERMWSPLMYATLWTNDVVHFTTLVCEERPAENARSSQFKMQRREDDEAKAAVSAEGALLWMLHALLRDHWRSADEFQQQKQQLLPMPELHYFAGNVSLLPAVTYQLDPLREQQESGDGGAVDVRAIKVQQKLFVHFVSVGATLRLALLCVQLFLFRTLVCVVWLADCGVTVVLQCE